MKEKGLCITCSSDKSCSFSREVPVVFCEEFSNLKIADSERGVKKEKSEKKR